MTNGKTCSGDARCRRMASNRPVTNYAVSQYIASLALSCRGCAFHPWLRKCRGVFPRILQCEGVSLLRADETLLTARESSVSNRSPEGVVP